MPSVLFLLISGCIPDKGDAPVVILVSPEDGSTQTSLVNFTWEVIDKSSENPTSVLHIVDVATSSDKEYTFKGSGKISTSLVLSLGEYEWFVEAFNGFASTKTSTWSFTVKREEYLQWKEIPLQSATEGEQFTLDLKDYILTSSPSETSIYLKSGKGEIENGVYKWLPDFDSSGVYIITVAASLHELCSSATFTIVVHNKNRPPSYVKLMTPLENSTDVVPNPKFSWEGFDPDLPDDTLTYTLYIESITSSEEFNTKSSTSFELNEFLNYGQTYTWKVKACDNYGLCILSDPSTFTVTNKGYVYLKSSTILVNVGDEFKVETWMDNFKNIAGYEIHVAVSTNLEITSADFYGSDSCIKITRFDKNEALLACVISSGGDVENTNIMSLIIKANSTGEGLVYIKTAEVLSNDEENTYYPVKVGSNLIFNIR